MLPSEYSYRINRYSGSLHKSLKLNKFEFLSRTGDKIVLTRTGFPAILPRRMAGNVGYKHRTLINDVEHDEHAQLTLVWIEASVSLYSYMRKGAYEKCDDYA